MGSLLVFNGQDAVSPKFYRTEYGVTDYVFIHASFRNQSYKNKVTQETYMAHNPVRRLEAPRHIPLVVPGSFPARESPTYGQIKM